MNEKIFNDAMVSRGGRFYEVDKHPFYEVFKSRANNLIRNFSSPPQTKKNIEVHFDIIKNKYINAVAFKKGIYFIGINAGAIVLLSDMFNLIMSHPEAFPKIGNSEVENSHKLFDKLPSNIDDLFIDGGYKNIQPVDPVRREYAKILTFIAFDFLIAHELVHIVNGHLDFMNSICNSQIISEVNYGEKNDVSTLTSQTLEYDADCIAAGIILKNSYSFQKQEELNGKIPKVGDYIGSALQLVYGNMYNLLYSHNLSTSLLFSLFGQFYWDMDLLSHYSHLPGPCRKIATQGVIENFIKLNNPTLNISKLENVSDSAFADNETSISLIVKNHTLGSGIFNAIDKRAVEQIATINKHWKEKVRKRLIPYTMGHTLAP